MGRLARAQVVAVQRMREAVVGNRAGGGAQRLRRDLAAVEGGGEGTARVVGAVEVVIELLDVEQLCERRDPGQLRCGGHRVTVSAGGGAEGLVASLPGRTAT